MVAKKVNTFKNAKRLPKGQRTHMRRLKQAARNDPAIILKSPK